ncbi:putative ATP-dependent endonuclease OLD family protein [Halorhabdus tiamatea SARL4B]|nr:putative ATP-dependent endonuclease OLD family protein [Halorhabdus tiamatea SARL4B]
MDLDEFLSQRYDEYLRLCQWFVSNIVEVADLNPEIEEITALNRDAVADKSDLRVQLTDRLESISQAFGDAEPIDEPPVETQGEAEFELPKISVIQKLANDLLRTLSNIDSPPNRIEDLPNIVDQSKINLADSEYDLRADEDNPVLRGLFALNNINLEDYSSLDSPEFRKSLDTAVEQLSLYLNWFWDSDPTGRQPIETVTPEETDSYRFEYELHEGTITLKLAEDETPPTPLEQRSDGMRWIITFLLTIIAQPYAQSGGRQTLVTLDDPGIHLHPEAEKQLFRAFFNVTNQAQIIYTTHSPALIDRKEVDRLRIVKNITEKKDSSLIGTRIANDLDDARTPGEQVDPLATAREAIGWTLSDSLFRGEQTVLVEGPSDKRYLNLFNDYFKWDGKPHLDKDPTFVDSKGGQLPFLSRILSAEDVNHVILMDDDSVNNGYEAEIEARTVRYNDLEIPDSREYEAEIEDLFDREFLIKAAAEVHDELDAEEALEPPYHTFECSIVSYIEEYLEQTEYYPGELCKYDLSMEVKDQLEKELRTSPEEHSETIERFQSVISELKEKIEKMDDE